ncbi:MspA family porin [Nocardia uniformis]|uniref:MspA family porin n=1 Tax=Nocardia uniformis TaxID=53432 RepID=A0A849BP26_9NOCA|nr:MspA family porin [Nocardia uniformis]NNH68333.1 MspA family porin [Nocardia uniformis]
MINRKVSPWLAGFGTAATTLGLLSAAPAQADTFVPLPGGEISRTLTDGTVVTVRLVSESATISPSMGSTPVHRNAWVSGRAEARVSGSVQKGEIQPGYVVGCQVNISGGGVNGGASGKSDWEGNASGGLTSGANLSLGPGQATSFVILDREVANRFGEEAHSPRNPFKGTDGSVTWSDSTIGLTGCGGYAQARAFVKVKVQTETVKTTVTLWGQPFSLG